MAKLSSYPLAGSILRSSTVPLLQSGNKRGRVDMLRKEQVVALVIDSSGEVEIDLEAGLNFTLLLDADVSAITFVNLPPSGYVGEFELEVTQDPTGGWDLPLPAEFKALGESDTAIAAAADAVTVLSAKTWDQGTTWRYAMQESA